jgi:hypothetical protein
MEFTEKTNQIGETSINIKILNALKAGYHKIIKPPFSGKLSRRSFMVGSAIGAGLSLVGVGQNPVNAQETANGQSDSTVPANSPEASLHIESHNPDFISKWNLGSSIMVSGGFGGVVARQLLGKGDMGLGTGLFMAGAWGAKEAILALDSRLNPDEHQREGSKHAFDHEAAEIKANMPVVGILVGLSELTSHIGYSEYGIDEDELIARMFTQGDKIEIELENGNDADVEIMDESDPKPFNSIEITANDVREFVRVGKRDEKIFSHLDDEQSRDTLFSLVEEQITASIDQRRIDELYNLVEEYKVKTDRSEEDKTTLLENLKKRSTLIKNQVAADVMKTAYISTIIAPMSLTYTSANVADKIAHQISTKILDMHFTDSIIKSIENDEDIISKQSAFEYSHSKTLEDMNGAEGFINLILTTAANVDGYALIGDPPNIFFLLKYGMKEWLINSAQGLALSGLISEGAYSYFLARKVGIKTHMKAGHQKAATFVFDKIKETGQNIINLLKFQSSQGNIDIPEHEFAEGSKFSFDSSALTENWKEILKDLAWKDEINTMMSDKMQSWRDIEAKILEARGGETIVKLSTEGKRIMQGLLKNFELLQNSESNPNPEEGLEAMGTALKAQLHNVLNFYGMDSSTEAELINNIADHLVNSTSNIMQNLDRFHNTDEAMEYLRTQEDISSVFLTSPYTENEFRKMINNYYKHRSQEGHVEHGAASHSAKDVRNALLTQLWAVGSLQTVCKKGLGLDNPDLHYTTEQATATSAAVLGIIGGISGIADNVAAMLFGIDILEKIAQKTVGQEIYENNNRLGSVMRKWAFYLAVTGGSLTKIGNGANMAIRKLSNIIFKDEENILAPQFRSNELSESVNNVYAYLATVINIGIGTTEIGLNLKSVVANTVEP